MWDICKLGLAGAQPFIVKTKLKIVLEVEIKTSFRNSKILFFKKN